MSSLYSVSTIKDNKENYEFFLEQNRASGVDHMFIFYEGSLPVDANQYRYVTFISSDELNIGINNLNTRQLLNTKRVVNYLISKKVSGWITAIDGDEVINFDKELLTTLEKEYDVIKLYPYEPIADGTADRYKQKLYKTILTPQQMNVLMCFNLIDNQDDYSQWLKGHTLGKYIARLTNRFHYGIHDAFGANRVFKDKENGVLHYESTSFKEFVRKYTNHTYNKAGFKDSRRQIVDFFKLYREHPEFINFAEIIYNNRLLEKNVDLKVKLGLIFQINRVKNSSSNIHIQTSNMYDVDVILISEKYADSLRDLAILCEKENCLNLACFFLMLANQARPWGGLIRKKLNKIKKDISYADKVDFYNDVKKEINEKFVLLDRDLVSSFKSVLVNSEKDLYKLGLENSLSQNYISILRLVNQAFFKKHMYSNEK